MTASFKAGAAAGALALGFAIKSSRPFSPCAAVALKRTRLRPLQLLCAHVSLACTPALSLTGQADPELDTVVVTGRAYNELSATSASKTETPLLETPQSVQVVTQQLIDDRRPVTLTEALYNASGVSDGGGRRATFDFPIIRGFEAATDVFLDGLRIERGSTNFAYELPGLERIEVLKGASSVLYGQGALGGAINQLSKRPTRAPSLEVEGTFGSYRFRQGRLDVSGPLTASVSARLNALYRSSEDEIDFLGKERTFLAPSLTWDLAACTRITLLGSYTEDETDGSYIGLPARGTVLPNRNGPLAASRNVREPDYDRLSIERLQLGYAFEHALSDAVTLHQNLRFSTADVLSRLTVALALLPDERTLLRGVGRFENEDRSTAVDTNLAMNFAAGGVTHMVLVGIDALWQDVQQSFAFGMQSPIDLCAPVYRRPVGSLFRPGSDFDRDDSLLGIYAQDQMRVGERLTVVAGARYDRSDTSNIDFVSGTRSEQTDDAFVPRVGGTYQLASGVAVYANYARSFRPNFGVAFSGAAFDVEEGESYEAGLKTALFADRLNSTVAIYEITRRNVLTADPDPAHAGFSIATGEQRSRGLDADVAYHVADRWNVILTYAYSDVEITRDSAYPGHRPINVPEHQASAFAKYQIPGGLLRGLSVGLGARHVGEREATLPNSYRLPSYTTVDAALSYAFERVRAQLNLYNLLDEEYFPSSASTGGIGVLVGEPLIARLTLGYRF